MLQVNAGIDLCPLLWTFTSNRFFCARPHPQCSLVGDGEASETEHTHSGVGSQPRPAREADMRRQLSVIDDLEISPRILEITESEIDTGAAVAPLRPFLRAFINLAYAGLLTPSHF